MVESAIISPINLERLRFDVCTVTGEVLNSNPSAALCVLCVGRICKLTRAVPATQNQKLTTNDTNHTNGKDGI